MRGLIVDPARATEGLYRRFVRRAQLEGYLADHLYAGEPYLAFNAVVLTQREERLLSRLTESFGSAFLLAGRSLAARTAQLQDMGFPWVAAELLRAEVPREPVIGRFDFVRDRDEHWWLLEYNADTPSGVREAIIADQLVHRLLPEARGLRRPNAVLAELIVQTFVEDLARGLDHGAAFGIVTDAGELEDLAQMAFTEELLRRPLAERGVEVILADVDNLCLTRRGLVLGEKRVGALYRYYPFEVMFGTPAFAAIYEAVVSGKVRLINGLFGLLLQHKGLLCWLWEHRDDPLLTADQRWAIREHMPPTWPIARFPEHPRRASVVVKQVFGREGEEVRFAEDLTADRWRQLWRERTHVVQRRVAVAEMDVAVPTAAGLQVRRGHATVGSFTVGGRWAGFYTRFGTKIITARAKWLATLVEGSGKELEDDVS